MAWARRRSGKFNAVRVFQHGRYWPSKLELAVYERLLLRERAGEITNLRCQVKVRFHTHDYGYVNMIPDFAAELVNTGETVYFEAKGVKTREYMRKEKAWALGGPGPLFVYSGNWRSPRVTKTVIPEKK